MLILEGTDNTGKTTVAKALSKLLPGWSYRHHSKPPIDVYTYFSTFLADSHSRVIVDRFHWSNYAYSQTYHDQPLMNKHQWRCLELMLMAQNTHTLYMYDDPENVIGRWGSGEMYEAKADKIRELSEHYLELYKGIPDADIRCTLPASMYNLRDLMDENGDPTEKLKVIAINSITSSTAASKLLPPSLGMGAVGGFMVIGDTPLWPADDDKRPQVPWNYDGWLWQAIDEYKVKWWNGYYTYASAFDSNYQMGHYIHKVIKPKKILYVGNVPSTVSYVSTLHMPIPFSSTRWVPDKWKLEVGEFLNGN